MKNNDEIKNVNFYFINSSFELILYKLCTTLLEKNYKVLIKMNTKDESLKIDKFFWTCEKYSFLPHSTFDDGRIEKEKILITHGDIEDKDFFSKFDILIISPNVLFKKLKDFKNFFFFTYVFDKNKNYNFSILEQRGFKIKAFREQKSFKWEGI